LVNIKALAIIEIRMTKILFKILNSIPKNRREIIEKRNSIYYLQTSYVAARERERETDELQQINAL